MHVTRQIHHKLLPFILSRPRQGDLRQGRGGNWRIVAEKNGNPGREAIESNINYVIVLGDAL